MEAIQKKQVKGSQGTKHQDNDCNYGNFYLHTYCGDLPKAQELQRQTSSNRELHVLGAAKVS